MHSIRLSIIVVLLWILSGVAWADDDNVLMIQGTYINLARGVSIDSATARVSYSNFGVAATVYWGADFGFLGTLGIYLPTGGWSETTFDGNTVTGDVEISDGGIAYSADLGVGWRLETEGIAFLLGGGAHVNAYSLFPPAGAGGESVGSWLLGVGTQASMIFPIGDVELNATLRGAYGFFEFMNSPELPEEVNSEGSFTWSVSAGVGFPI